MLALYTKAMYRSVDSIAVLTANNWLIDWRKIYPHVIINILEDNKIILKNVDGKVIQEYEF